MSGRRLLPGIVLILLMGGITAAFLLRRGPRSVAPLRETGARAGPLAQIGPILRGLDAGADADVTARMHVDGVLRAIDGSPRREILGALGSDDWGAQWAGLLAAPSYGPTDEAFARAVWPLLSSEIRTVRRAAAGAAALIGPGYERLEPSLRRLARDDAEDVRAAALRTLARRANDLAAQWPLFVAALADVHGDARAAAAQALSRIELQEALRPEDVVTVRAALCKALSDDLPDVRMYAAMALGRAGPQAAPDVPALVALLGDESTLVRGTVASALGSIGEAALPAIEARLKADDGAIAASLLWSLRLIGEPAVPVLRRATKHRSTTVRLQAAFKLHELGQDREHVLELHIQALQSGDVAAIRLAARNLSRIGTEAAVARSALEAVLDHEDETVRAAARAALASIAPVPRGR